jgi:hypothetical protein
LEYDEIIETSKTNQNVLRALWFGGTVSALLLTPDQRSYLIICRPSRTHISGRVYRERYQAARASGPDTDLAAVWVLKPLSFLETSLEKRRLEEEARHPLLKHLDRLTV